MGKQGRGGHSGRGTATAAPPARGNGGKTAPGKARLSDGGGAGRKGAPAGLPDGGKAARDGKRTTVDKPAGKGVHPKGGDGRSDGGFGAREAKRRKVAHEQVEEHATGRLEGKKKKQGAQSHAPAVTNEPKNHRAAVSATEDTAPSAAAVAPPQTAVTTVAAAAEPVAAAGGRRVANSNWEALKQAVAATKKPPPPEHVLKKRAGKKDGGGSGAAAAAAGRRPGVVGNETGLTKVLALDCEMVGVGPKGAESALARVCLVNSAGAVLLDTFVQPKEKVTDYRTWVSGVRPSDLERGRLYDEVVQQVGEMVKGRVLVGHALGHDLRALLLEEHPRSQLRDTSKYPGLMKELPGGRKVSASLKDLAATHLGLTIQEGEHSPVDDARAALYLYQKYHREWEAAIKSGQLVPVVGGLGKGKRKSQRTAAAAKGGKASARGKARGAKTSSGRAKERGAPGVAEGGVRKQERLARMRGKSGKDKGGGVGGKAGPGIWSLDRDPYADL